MYGLIVRRIVRAEFRRLSAGAGAAIPARFAAGVVFCFAGDHALGGELRGPDAARRWFGRLYRLFPGIRLEPRAIAVSGWPWDTLVTTRFRVTANLPGDRAYTNEGVQLLRLRWGRAVEDRLYEDTGKLVAALAYLATQGVGEATAPPLGGVPVAFAPFRAERREEAPGRV